MPRYAPLTYGEGTVTKPKRRGDPWRGRVLVNGKRTTVYGASEGEVRTAMAAARDHDGTSTREVPTLGEWLTEWTDEYTSSDASANTLSNYRWAVDKWEPLSDVYLDDLTVRTVNRHLQTLATGGLSRSSCERARTVLAMALDKWNDDQQWTFNPARRATIPKRAKVKAERRTLTPEQARDLLSVTHTTHKGIAVDLMLWLALRPGEACGLRWDAIDLDAGTVDIVQFRRVDFDTGAVSYAAPKAKSDRPLALPAPLVDALRARWAQQARDRLAAGPAWVDSGLVVTTNVGTPVDPHNLRRTVRTLARSVGIFDRPDERDLTPYELRHTAASLLVESGMALEEVSDLLGHANVRTLLESYRHRSRRTVSEHVAVTERLYG